MDTHQYQRVISGNGANFMSLHRELNWRGEPQPLLLTAWTQTCGEDFEMLRSVSVDPNLEAENRALHDKVSYLEAKLQQHTELLSQIHATSARMQSAMAVASPSSPTTLAPPQPQILTPPSSVICAPVQQQQHQNQRSEVVDYKIIAATTDNNADDIEIRLAAESLNSLSTSADSDRLEICLAEEQQQQEHYQQQHHHPQPHILNNSIKRESLSQMDSNGSAHLQFIKRRKLQELPEPAQNLKLPSRQGTIKNEPIPGQDNVMVSIGPNNTLVPASIFENINWSASSLATRKLLVTIFDRETLATHSMTGKPSPAFKDQHKPLKQMLDPLKIADIIFAVTHKCNASEKEVRNAITTKCADENKMSKIQKRRTLDKENINISPR